MTKLVVTGLATLPGAQRLSQFMIYLAASPDGASAGQCRGQDDAADGGRGA